MRLLLVSPDYLSHYLPMGEIAEAWRNDGGDVVVASGPGMRARASAAGLDTVELTLGQGHNDGIAAVAEQPGDESARLARFLAVTRDGPIPTLMFQTEQRRQDLLWQPREVAARVGSIVETVAPDVILVDQLAYAATLALRAGHYPYAGFVTGHPTAVPGPGETYDVPPHFPSAIPIAPADLAELQAAAGSVSAGFAATYGTILRELDPTGIPPTDAFAATGTATLFNYPEALHAGSGRVLPPASTFLGAVARNEVLSSDLDAVLSTRGLRPRVYVSLGTFLSSRADLLRVVADGLRALPVDVVMATGAADPAAIGCIPPGWVLRPFLPQVAVLERCDVVVTHGGNNTITESLRAGLPMLVLPLSTDQFAGAADLARAGLGVALDARSAYAEQVATAVLELMGGPASARAAALGERLRLGQGAPRAVERLRVLAQRTPVIRPDRAPATRS